MFRTESVTPKDVSDTIKAHLKLDHMASDSLVRPQYGSLVRVEEKVRYFAIIKKGTKKDPQWMMHCWGEDQLELCQEDDNLPDFQPYPEFIDKDEIDEMGGEVVEVELKIL